MSIQTLQDRLHRSLERDRALPAAQKVKKALRYAAGTALAPVFLLACDSVGPGARTRGRPVIVNAGTLTIGARVAIASMFAPTRLTTGPLGTLALGDDVTINFGCSLTAEAKVTLGDRVSLGPYVAISDSDGDPSEGLDPKPIAIGNDVWLAARVRVKRGVVIGDGAVITAGSEVCSDIPPGVIAGGVPARVLRPVVESDSEMVRAAVPGPEAPRPVNVAAEKPAEPLPPEVRGLLLGDFSIQELALHLRAADPLGPRVDAVVEPFGQVVQTLHTIESEVAAHKADFAVVWTRPDSIAAFREMLLGQPKKLEDVLAEVDAFAGHVQSAAAAIKTLFVPTWVLPPHERGRGMIDLRPGGLAYTVQRMNLRLADALAGTKNVYLLDAQRWVGLAGRDAISSKLWFLGKVGFSAEVFAAAASDVRAALRGLKGNARKVIVLDLDNTLWGGIVGDTGWEHLHLGGHDPAGEAYVELQHRLMALSRRGILLAVVSKNEESVALEAMRRHPAMVIRPEDLAAFRINWRDKAANIAELATELNLGLQSFVFLDDNPVERARVHETLPEVLVPDWPEDVLLYPQALLELACFDTPSISKEDLERSKMYAAERGREALKKEVGSLDEWLKSLHTRVAFARLDAGNLARTTQLLNKTNQMNLSTRRLGEPELSAWAAAPGHELWTISVADKLGDSGLTGILGLEMDGDVLRITDYILSCRVMGRRVEETLLAAAVSRAKALGAQMVEAKFLPTPKNKPCFGFFKGSGFEHDEPNSIFRKRVSEGYPLPAVIEAVGLDLGAGKEVRS
ncbi:MAG: HAD-IIIC family phosphatase [Polyangiaceae bacterium]